MRFTVSLRTLFGVVVLVSIALAIIAHRYHKYWAEQRAIKYLAARHPALMWFSGEQSDVRDQEIPGGSIHTIHFMFSKDITIDDFQRLPRFSRLASIDLSCTNVADQHVSNGPDLPQVRNLNLLLCFRVTDKSVPSLVTRFPNLETLSLTATGITDSGLPYLAGLHRLRLLDLSRTAITGRDLDLLAAGCPELKELYLDETKISDESLSALASFSGLEKVSLRGEYVTPRAINTLVRCKNLREAVLPIMEVDADTLTEVAEKCPRLRLVNIRPVDSE